MKGRKMIAYLLTIAMVLSAFLPGEAIFATSGGASAKSVAGAMDVTLTGDGTEDSPYQIGTAEEFAAMPESSIGKYFLLTDDIEVSAPYASDFQGVFDGGGHTVTLSIESTSAYNGLFSQIKGPAVVKNLLIEGSIAVEGKSYTGAVAGAANGFNDGTNDGVTIQNCRSRAEISAYKAVGGIVGMTSNGVTITGCGNSGTVTGSNTQVGGIVGNAAGSSTDITDCYNTGAVTGFNMTGGIIGQATKSSAYDNLTNCYDAGAVSITTTNTNIGSLTGNKSDNGTRTNCYVLDTAAEAAVGGATVTEGITVKTESEMKDAGFVSALGSSFAADTKGLNDGYPVLAWENTEITPASRATVNFTVTPEDAVIKVNNKAVSGSSVQLKAGTHSYSVSKEGYKTVAGEITVTQEQADTEAVIDLDPIVLPELTGITLSGYETEYQTGDELRGLIVTAQYSDDSEEEVTGYTTDFDSSQPAENKTVTVTYQGKTATFTVTITARGSVLDPLAGKMNVTLIDGSYGFAEDMENAWLVTNNQSKSSTTAKMTMTAVSAGMFSFSYKVGSEAKYDKFSFKKGDTAIINEVSGNIDWTEQSVLLSAGDTVSFEYKKDSSGDQNGDSVWIKDLSMSPAYKVTLNVTPANAAVVLKDSSENEVVPSVDGTYTVTDGTYTYTATAFGYEDKTGTITVSGEDVTETIALTKLSSQEVTFAVTVPEGMDASLVQIKVMQGSEEISPSGSGTYELPAGEYTYTVTHPRCNEETGSFTVSDSAQTVSVEMTKKDSVLDPILDQMDVELTSDRYGFSDEPQNGWLVSNNKGVDSSSAVMTMTAKSEGLFSVKYKVSSENRYDKFTIEVGSQKIVDAVSGTIDWTGVSQVLREGDVVTFTYTKDNSSASGDDCVWIKDLAMDSVHTVTFSTTPADAGVKLKDAEGNAVAGDNGSFSVVDGTYTYTVSAFGYEEKTGTVTVDGEDITETVELTKLAVRRVTFDVQLPDGMDSADIQIEVRYGDEVIPPAEGYYELPAGEYTYKVTHPYCDDAAGSFTVADEDIAVGVTLRKTLTLADFISSDLVTAANDTNYPYKGVYSDSGNYLESTNNGNSQVASITLTFSGAASLSFDYWTQVGTSPSYGLTISKGSTELKRVNGSNDWTNYSVNVASGDVITIRYSRQYNEAADNCVRFKNFVITKLYRVAFTVPEGASVALMSGSGEISGSSGAFDVANGTYSYTVSKFGYEDKTGTVTVDGEDLAVTVGLEDMVKLDSRDIAFTVSPEDAEVTVTHVKEGVMTAAEGIYSLPVGETFTYRVSKGNYITAEGTFTVSEDRVIKVTLTYAGEAWDGETKTQPSKGSGTAEDPYIINNGEELAWLAAEVNAGNGSLSAKLADNINLGDKAWTAIGNYSTNYTGIFDGNGMTVSGLTGVMGLFDYAGAGAVIKELAVSGAVLGDGNIGGVADTCYGTIENVLFRGSVTNSNTYSTGGIVGRLQSGGKLIGCVNTGTVTNSSTYTSTINTGGIVGYSYGEIVNCYNTGRVTADPTKASTCIGGLAGKNYGTGTIRNSYNAGTVEGPADGAYNFAGLNEGTISNSYVLDTVGGKETSGIMKKTAEEMKEEQFVIDLGADAYNFDSDDINGGFAILKWQGGTEVTDPSAIDVAAAKNALKLQAKKGDDVFDLEEVSGIYIVKPGAADNLILPEEGAEGTAISWSADIDGTISLSDGTITYPEAGKQTVLLTALITKGQASAEKMFTVSVWSEQAVVEEQLDAMAARLTGTGITASQIAHPDEVNIGDVVRRALGEAGFDTEGLTAVFVSTDGENAYIGEDGTITYYKGETSGMNYAVCSNSITVKLQKAGAEKSCILKQLLISWDKAYVMGLMEEYRALLTWNSFRGERDNEAELDETGTVPVSTVAGYVDGELRLPAQAGASTVEWTTDDEQHAQIGSRDYDQDMNMYYPCTLVPSAAEDKTVRLEAEFTYNRLNDCDTAEGAEPVTAKAAFILTIEQNDNPGVDKEKVQKALDEEYAGMIKDFVYKDQDVDLSALTDDIQLPTPTDLEKTDILPDRENEQVIMESSDSDVLMMYGYHGYVYRPLPGEDDKSADLTVSIKNRTNGSIVASTTVHITVKAFTQDELDQAAAEMQAVATEDVYWAGLAGDTSNTKDNVTENLSTYSEIWKTEDGYEYVKGIDANFSFIKLDDIPGYDPMGAQKWRIFRSNKESVIASETLLVTRPEEKDEQVKLDSVMSYVKYANYWEHFVEENESVTDADRERYAFFEQFYKVPVEVTVTVTAPHIHKIVHFPAKEATETEDGNKEYWMCTSCGKYFSDEEGTQEITWDDIVIPKSGSEPEPEGTVIETGGAEYKVTESSASTPEVTIINGTDAKKVTIPASVEYEGVKYKVTAIAQKAFYRHKKLVTFNTGANIRTIGASAFAGCSGLKSFTIGKNVTKIGSGCFSKSKKLKTLIVKSKKLKKSSVRKMLKGSSVRIVKVKVGSRSVNRKYVKKYKKIFTKKNCGRKVTVK